VIVASKDPTGTDVDAKLDPEEIFASVGEVPYDWADR